MGISLAAGALLGTNLTDDGLSLLHKIGIKKVVLMLDGDAAGRIATAKLSNKLSPFFEVVPVYLESGKDPKDIPLEELKEICLKSVGGG